MVVENLEINNFRAIKKLKIESFKRLNILVGKNNSGKSTILESIFLLCGISNPQLIMNIHLFRDLMLNNDEDFSFIFRNLDFKNTPLLKFNTSTNENRKLSIEPMFEQIKLGPPNYTRTINEEARKEISLTVNTESVAKTINGIKTKFSIYKSDKEENHEAEISIFQGRVKFDTNYKEKIPCSFLTQTTMYANWDSRLENLIVHKELKKVIERLKLIDPKIQDLQLGAKGMIYVDYGLNTLIPVNICGDGIRRILAVISAIHSMKNGAVIIDELENGFHYSALETLWSSIIEAAHASNVQVFVSTHSYESLQVLGSVLKEKMFKNDDIRVFRIETNDKEHSITDYDDEIFSAALEEKFEIR